MAMTISASPICCKAATETSIGGCGIRRKKATVTHRSMGKTRAISARMFPGRRKKTIFPAVWIPLRVFRNCWYQLPPKWNRFNMNYMRARDFRDYRDRFEYWNRPVIMHFSDYKPQLRCIGVKGADIYQRYYTLSGCDTLKPEKAGLAARLKPLSSYLFRTTLKSFGLYEAYLYRRLCLRNKLGRVK